METQAKPRETYPKRNIGDNVVDSPNPFGIVTNKIGGRWCSDEQLGRIVQDCYNDVFGQRKVV